MMAAAAHTVFVIVVMMAVMLFFSSWGVLVGLCSHGDWGSLKSSLVDMAWDLLTGQPSHAVVTMVAVGFFSRSMATAAAIFSSLAVWVRLSRMQLAWLIWSSQNSPKFFIHLHLVHIGHGDKAVQLHIQMLSHAFHSAGHIGELAHAGGLDDDAVGVVLLHHLLQGGAEIAHQRAADAAGVQLVDLDAAFLQKAAVNADLAELVLDQHHLLAGKGLFDELFDQGSFTGTKEAGENIDFWS